MGSRGTSSGLKRKPAPGFWPIHRKDSTWIVKPASGPHTRESCLPLTIILRDILGLSRTRKEAKTIVSQGRILVDGKLRRKDNFPVGLMDVVSIPDIGQSFRVLPSAKGLILHPIGKDEAKFKLCRVEDKRVVAKGRIQLNLHDGSNILLQPVDPTKPLEGAQETLATLKISIPERQIEEVVKMGEKTPAIITGGKNVGKTGKIVDVEKATGKKCRTALVTIENHEGDRHQTIRDFVFAIGSIQPLISLPEVG